MTYKIFLWLWWASMIGMCIYVFRDHDTIGYLLAVMITLTFWFISEDVKNDRNKRDEENKKKWLDEGYKKGYKDGYEYGYIKHGIDYNKMMSSRQSKD